MSVSALFSSVPRRNSGLTVCCRAAVIFEIGLPMTLLSRRVVVRVRKNFALFGNTKIPTLIHRYTPIDSQGTFMIDSLFTPRHFIRLLSNVTYRYSRTRFYGNDALSRLPKVKRSASYRHLRIAAGAATRRLDSHQRQFRSARNPNGPDRRKNLRRIRRTLCRS